MPYAVWSPEAVTDLEKIANYIAFEDGRPSTADEIVRGAHDLCSLVATQPEMGHSRSEFGIGCRVVSYKNRWMILYRPSSGGIDVLRLVDGTRDYGQLF